MLSDLITVDEIATPKLFKTIIDCGQGEQNFLSIEPNITNNTTFRVH